ncbi:MAG: extracellular solute-binding protein [Spirochaetaceae bacterium]
MNNLKQLVIIFLLLLLSTTMFGNGQKESTSATGAQEVTFWTFNELHQQFYEAAAERWNIENPDRQIELMAETFPYDDMHNKLLIALQSGVGAPALADIEISKFPNYLKGQVQLEALNDYIDPVADELVLSRYQIYSKDNNYYGLPFHVGAAVMYYNVELLTAAGVNVDDIETWDDYVVAGAKVKSVTGKLMTTVETTDQWTFWPMISQRNSDFFNTDGSVALDNSVNISTLEFLHDMIYKNKIAEAAPGGFHHSEEYYGAMNAGDYASILMPMWYMGRFTDYMPELEGKIVIKPLPSWEKGGKRSAGMGGTATVVTKQAEDVQITKDFLAFAKLTEESNIELWSVLGFDPPRWSVWNDEALKAENKFTKYFQNDDIFSILLEVKDEINPVTITSDLPELSDLIKHDVMFQALGDQSKTPAQALKDAADKIRN